MWEFWKSRFKTTTLSTRHSAQFHREQTVNFKDLNIRLQHALDDALDDEMAKPQGKVVEKNKLIIVIVGLPGRGKTFLCNKLVSYLSWYATTSTRIRATVR